MIALPPGKKLFETTRRVEFHQTDAAGIVHFAAFFPMLESVEHQWLRSIGHSVMPPPGTIPRVTFPRVAASCDYRGPARFEDVLTFVMFADHVGRSSVRYRFEITRDADAIATGSLTVVSCELSEAGLTKVPLPESIRERLTETKK